MSVAPGVVRATDLSHRPVIQGLLEAIGHPDVEPGKTGPRSPGQADTETRPLAPDQRDDPPGDALDDLADDRLWTEADRGREPAGDKPAGVASGPFTPPVPVVHRVEPPPELEDDLPLRRPRLPGGWRWIVAAGLLVLTAVVVATGSSDPVPPTSGPAPRTTTAASEPAPTATQPRTPSHATRSGTRPRAIRPARGRPRVTPKPPVRTPVARAEPSRTPARPAPRARSPWSEEFFRP